MRSVCARVGAPLLLYGKSIVEVQVCEGVVPFYTLYLLFEIDNASIILTQHSLLLKLNAHMHIACIYFALIQYFVPGHGQ